MSINLSNSVTNTGNTPNITTGLFADRGSAVNYTYGAIYISIDTGNISQSDGTNWVNLSGGGGGTNPTSTRIPLNIGGVFVDSCFQNAGSNTSLVTIDNSNNIQGIGLNFAFRNYKFGEYDGISGGNNTFLFIDDNNKKIATNCNGIEFGLTLDFTNKTYYIGDYNGGGYETFFAVDDNNRTIYASWATNANGISLDFLNGIYQFGNYNSGNNLTLEDFRFRTFYNGANKGLSMTYTNDEYLFGDLALQSVMLKMSYNDKEIKTYYDNNLNGLFFDFLNNSYYIGDYDGIYNGSNFSVNDGTQTFQFSNGVNAFLVDCNNARLEATPNFLTTSAGSNSTQHLKIFVSGVEYRIQLKNP